MKCLFYLQVLGVLLLYQAEMEVTWMVKSMLIISWKQSGVEVPALQNIQKMKSFIYLPQIHKLWQIKSFQKDIFLCYAKKMTLNVICFTFSFINDK